MDLGIQFFTAAKAQHESGAKWSLIVLILILYLHLAIVGPFAKQTADKAEIDRDLLRNQELEEQLVLIVDSAVTFVAAVELQVNEAAAGLRQELIERFAVLENKIRRLAELGRQEAEGEAGAQLFGPELAVSFQQQQQQQPLPQPDDLLPILEPMPSILRGLFAEDAQDPGASLQYAEEMERYINEFVIAPAFKRANESWTSNHLQALTESAAQLDAEIEAALKKGGAAADQIKALQVAVAALREEAQHLAFAPPAGSNWWRTIAGKDSSIHAMVDAMTRGVGKIGQRQSVLQAAKDKASAAVADSQTRAQEAADRLVELEQQAEDLQAQLGEIGEPLKVISIRLSLLAPLLPLIIGLAIAALTLWRAEALRRMRFAAGLVADEGEGSLLRRWLQAAAGGSVSLLAAREVAIGAVAIAWVLVAWQAVRSLPAPHVSGPTILGIALAVLAGSRAYHWYQSNQALTFAERR